MNKYLKNLNRIEFVVTMACSGRCKHCSQGSHISNEHIDAKIAEQAIYDICSHYNIDSLMTFGGEPLLYPETVCKIHSAARKMNIPQRELITNGYFSKDVNRIKEVAHMLSQSGVKGICLSVDAFHQETIPLEYVKEFASAVVKEEISIHTHPAWLVSADDDNPHNLKTRELLNEFNAMGIEQSSGNVIFPSGNALKYLGEYFDQDVEYDNPYRENPKDVKTISFSANGDVLGGNIYDNSILEIIKSYDLASENVVMLENKAERRKNRYYEMWIPIDDGETEIIDKQKLIIRTANADDADDICRICCDDLGYNCTSALIEQRLTERDLGREQVFVAEYDNSVVGFVHVEDYKTLYFEELANLLGLAVSKKYRRQGIATALIKQAEYWAKEKGINMIRLNSGSTRKEAHRFYRSLGFDNEKEQIRFMKKL